MEVVISLVDLCLLLRQLFRRGKSGNWVSGTYREIWRESLAFPEDGYGGYGTGTCIIYGDEA